MLTVELQESVAVPRDKLWRVLAEVLRQKEFVAYHITHARQSNAADLGPEFKWKEQGVLLGRRYDCECCIFAWEPPEWLCFGTKNLFHVSYELTPQGEGTAIGYRCELPQTPDSRRDEFTNLCRQSLLNLRMMLEGVHTAPVGDVVI